MKWLVDTMGIDELRERILKERKFLRARARLAGRHPRAGAGATATRPPAARRRRRPTSAAGIDVPVKLLSSDPYERWEEANVVRGVANGTISAMAYSRARRHHHRAVPRASPTSSATSRSTSASRTARTSRCATSPRPTCAPLYDRLTEIGMAEPGAELARDVVSCPGADTCNLAVTQSRGLAAAIGDALEDAGLAEVRGVRVNISGCTNSCGQHHISDIGFFGLERRAHGRAAPGYQMLLGGHLGDMRGRVRRQGHEAAGQDRARSGRAHRRPLQRASARPARRSRRGSRRSGGAEGRRRHAEGSRPLPHSRRRPRVLRRLRRDRSVRRRGRRRGVRGDMTPARTHRRHRRLGRSSTSTSASSPRSRPSSSTSPRRRAIKWAWERFGTGRRARRVVPGLRAHRRRGEGRARHRGRVPRHAVPLRGDALVRRARPRALRPQPHGHGTARRARRPLADRSRRVLRDAQGRAARPRARAASRRG